MAVQSFFGGPRILETRDIHNNSRRAFVDLNKNYFIPSSPSFVLNTVALPFLPSEPSKGEIIIHSCFPIPDSFRGYHSNAQAHLLAPRFKFLGPVSLTRFSQVKGKFAVPTQQTPKTQGTQGPKESVRGENSRMSAKIQVMPP